MQLSKLWYRLFLSAAQVEWRSNLVASADWIAESKRGATKPLAGIFSHWCAEWDEMPVDETVPEIECCYCFDGWRFNFVRSLCMKVTNFRLARAERRARKREKARADALQPLIEAGALSVNDVRRMLSAEFPAPSVESVFINGVEYVPKQQGVVILPPGVKYEPIAEIFATQPAVKESRAHMAALELESDPR